MRRAPYVSVIVPVRDDSARLARCLSSLTAQRYPADCFEIIVVDNASSPPVPRGAYRLLHEATPSSYAARNRGARAARGEILAFTDSDCRPDPEWLARGVAALGDDEQLGLVAGRITLTYRNPRRPNACERYDALTGFAQAFYVEHERFGATANLFTRTSIWKKVGPFDPRLKSGGDVQWGRRLADLGFRLAYADDAIVHHPARATLRELVDKTARVARGRKAIAQGMFDARLFLKRLTRTGREGLAQRSRASELVTTAAIGVLLRIVEALVTQRRGGAER